MLKLQQGRAEAIHNLGGMEAIYLKYVERFHENYHDSFQKLCQHLSIMEYEEAERLAHSIRGLAATLGMRELQIQAEALEFTIKEGRYRDLPPLLNAFQSALDQANHFSTLQSSSLVGT
jgi:HPt (histidine-containing phosphotransfer) domain-containing protein